MGGHVTLYGLPCQGRKNVPWPNFQTATLRVAVFGIVKPSGTQASHWHEDTVVKEQDVFAEQYTGVAFEAVVYPENVDQWVEEILALPLNADYNHWMNEHPDGRLAIGYRTGRYIVHQAIDNSGKSILELSKLSPDEILKLAKVE